MKDIKIVIGANYGDEGKGLLVNYFTKQFESNAEIPIIVLHNGTAQRGHTVDYNDKVRHVYHHFGSGTQQFAPTFFANSFLIHPMEFVREWHELVANSFHKPICFCDPNAYVITPYDMLVDRATQDWIQHVNGAREFGSCGFGSWCAAQERLPMNHTCYKISDFVIPQNIPNIMNSIFNECIDILNRRGVDIEYTGYSYILDEKNRVHTNARFAQDIAFFLQHTKFITFDELWHRSNAFIFQNGQGLGLDKNINGKWHTTSNTGMKNPYDMLNNKFDFVAETCYVTRSYLTRHGEGYLEEQVVKSEINNSMADKTNVTNNYQGQLRYGYIEDNDQKQRIANDWSIVADDVRFTKSLAVTHTNEFNCGAQNSEYYSDNPFNVTKRT